MRSKYYYLFALFVTAMFLTCCNDLQFSLDNKTDSNINLNRKADSDICITTKGDDEPIRYTLLIEGLDLYLNSRANKVQHEEFFDTISMSLYECKEFSINVLFKDKHEERTAKKIIQHLKGMGVKRNKILPTKYEKKVALSR